MIKQTNPKDAIGVRKSATSVLSANVKHEIALGLLEGACKYGRHNYRVAGVRYSVYYDAANRHLDQWWEGEDIDKDSGLSHVTKAMSCLMVLRDSMLRENATDDRPPKCQDGWLEEIYRKAGEILDKYPEPVEAYIELSDKKLKNDTN